jgi:hypothetical protein
MQAVKPVFTSRTHPNREAYEYLRLSSEDLARLPSATSRFERITVFFFFF